MSNVNPVKSKEEGEKGGVRVGGEEDARAKILSNINMMMDRWPKQEGEQKAM